MSKRFTRMQRRCERELRELDRWIAALLQERKTSDADSVSDNTPLSETIDSVQAGEAEVARSELLARMIEKSAGLQQALRRMRDGSFGVCVTCGEQIHSERIEAIPETSYCLSCQTRLEQTLSRIA